MTIQQLIWKKVSNHLHRNLMHLKTVSIRGEIFHVRKTTTGHYYLVTADENHCSKLEPYEGRKLVGDDKPVLRAPFEFHYGFENTMDGEYLTRLIPHLFSIKPIAKRKAADIIRTYGKFYVKINYQVYRDMVRSLTTHLSIYRLSSRYWLLSPEEFQTLTGESLY